MRDERAEPFVAYMAAAGIRRVPKGACFSITGTKGTSDVPVVVTPLLPSDPKPDEVWEDGTGNDVEIWSAPFPSTSGPITKHKSERLIQTDHGVRRVKDLRPKPTLKTYRLTFGEDVRFGGPTRVATAEIQAESREAALAKLALEEV